MSLMKKVCLACDGKGHNIGYTFWGRLQFLFYYLMKREMPGPTRIECQKCVNHGFSVGDIICVNGVTIFPYWKSQEKAASEYPPGTHILLDPSEESVVALSNEYKPLAEFKKLNKLKGYVMSRICNPSVKFIF